MFLFRCFLVSALVGLYPLAVHGQPKPASSDTAKVFALAERYHLNISNYYSNGHLDSAVQGYHNLKEVLAAYPEHPLHVRSALQYAEIMREIGRPRDGLLAITNALVVASKTEHLAYLYNSMAGLYYEIGRQDSSLYFTKLSIQSAGKWQTKLAFKNEWMLGALYKSLGKLPEAINHLQIALRLLPEDEAANRNIILIHLGTAYYAMGKKKEGIDTLRYALDDSKKYGTITQRVYAAREYFTAIANLTPNQKALLDTLLVYQDSIHAYKKASNIALLEARAELSVQKENNAILTLKANEQEAMQQHILLFGVGVLLVSGLILLFTITTRRQKRLIVQQNQALSAQQAELERKQKDLEHINSSKDALLSVVSHDVRGPLLTLGATLQLLAQGHLSEQETKTIIQGLAERVHDTETLLNDVLLWTKGNMQGLYAQEEVLQADALLQEVLVQIRPLLQTNQVVVQVEGVPFSFFGDEGLAKVVLRNVLTNAVRHGARPGTVIVRFLATDSEAGIEVEDHGKGMPPELVHRLQAAQSEDLLPTKGMLSLGGLGLVLVKDFVARQHGHIAVQTSAAGTKLAVWFRRA